MKKALQTVLLAGVFAASAVSALAQQQAAVPIKFAVVSDETNPSSAEVSYSSKSSPPIRSFSR